MCTLSMSELQRHERLSRVACQHGRIRETRLLLSIVLGLVMECAATFLLGGLNAVWRVGLADAKGLLFGVPSNLLYFACVAYCAERYFGTLREAVLRVSAMTIVIHALGVFGFAVAMATGTPLLVPVLEYVRLGVFLWMIASVFELEVLEFPVMLLLCAPLYGAILFFR